MRALHVFARLDRGGAETWLMDVVRRVDRSRLAIDVCVIGSGVGTYEPEFESLGGTVFRCPLDVGLLRFRREFGRLLAGQSFDVVHTHLYLFSGLILRIAAAAGVPRRVAHLHQVEDVKRNRLGRRLYAGWMRRWIRRYGTHFVGPTVASLKAFWGANWTADDRHRVLYNGVDVQRFSGNRTDSVLKELDIPAGAKVVLNVGRFVPNKGHHFLLKTAHRILQDRPDTYFICVGSGALRDEIMAETKRMGVDAKFRFIDGTPNVHSYCLAADCFLFPSTAEGFGIVIAEAGAAGLPVVARDLPGIREAAAACRDVVLLPITATLDDWAKQVIASLDRGVLSDADRQAHASTFPFSIQASIRSLEHLYSFDSC